MDYKLTKESFAVSKTIFDGTVQQSLELDYILPDYYPEIFKVLSLKLMPSITKRTIGQNGIDFELTGKVRLIYLSESGELSAVEQTLSYGKSIEMPLQSRSPRVSIIPYTDSVSCRVVNKRRVDIRGIITIAVKVTADEQRQAVSQCSGGGLQLKKSLITYPAKRIAVTKRVTVADDIELGLARQPLKTVIRTDCAVTSADKKILSGKLLIKGESEVTLLYIPEESCDPESIKFSIPFSQISDIEGLDERFEVSIDAYVTGCEIKPSNRSEGPAVNCELSLEINILAMKFESAELATDAFSTKFETETESICERIESSPQPINDTHKAKSCLTYNDGDISSVIQAGAEVGRLTQEKGKDGLTYLRGNICFFAYVKNESGKPVYLECSETFRHELSGISKDSCAAIEARAAVSASSFNLTSSNSLEISADIRLCGYIFEDSDKTFISSIVLNEAKPIEAPKDCAIKLYYAEKGEEPWNIAKRCRASLKAIAEENELDCECLEEGRMILIPIVD